MKTDRLPSLCHVLHGFGLGGMERQLAQVVNATTGEFRHTIVALNGDLACRAKLDNLSAVRFADPPAGAGRHTYFVRLARWLRRDSPDLVLSYGWAGVDAILAARLAGLHRIVHAEHGIPLLELERQLPRRLWMRRVFFRLATRLVVPSDTLHRVARDRWWLPEHRICRIPSSVETDRFPVAGSPAEQRDARRRFGIDPSALVVGTVARLAPPKNLGLLLESFAALRLGRQTHLLIVGDGLERAHLEREAVRLGIRERTTFAGEVDVLLPYYRCMDIFAMSSVTEQRSLSLLEAMASGLPAVVTDAGDSRAMLPPASRAFVVAPGDRIALARNLSVLLEDADQRRALGAANASFCRRHFDARKAVRDYRALYRAALVS